MAQQLITPQHTSKYKTFEEICPIWSKALKSEYLTFESAILFNKTCVVGEAHGFTDNYVSECIDCYRFSNAFPSYIYNPNRIIELNSLIDNFTKHYNKCHIS